MASESKRRRSAGPAKPTPTRPPVRRRSSWTDIFALDSERSSRLLLIGGVVLVLLIAVGFVGFGYYNSVIKPRNRTVLEADGITVSYSAMERRMRYEADQHPDLHRDPTRRRQTSWYASSTPPRSRRKRSLSSFSPVCRSQRRHVSGEISSPR